VRAAGRYLQSFESAFSADGVKTIMRLFPGTDASATAAALTPHTILEACQRACATISRLEAAVAALKADADAAVAGFDKAVAEHHAVTAHRLRQQLHELQSQVHVTTTEVMQKQQRMHDEALEAQVLLQCCSIIKKCNVLTAPTICQHFQRAFLCHRPLVTAVSQCCSAAATADASTPHWGFYLSG
jgi:TolA-binding protein